MEKLLITEKKWVYSELVQHDNDVLGIVAYALYKKDKHETATQYRNEGRDEEFIAARISEFHDQVASISARQVHYRTLAEQVINETLGLAVKNVASELNKQVDKIKADLKLEEKLLTTKNDDLIKRETALNSTIEQRVKKEVVKIRREHLNKLADASENLRVTSWPRRTLYWVLNGFSGIVATTITGIAILAFAAYTADEATQKNLLQNVAKYVVELMSADPIPISTNSLEVDSKTKERSSQ
ncbi:hypothetical protein [Shewanella sp.]|uniref:hypothetical protein n=1 Tax=Shewanella sp. TaxID=50422 RepID=UPI000E90BAA2|nr:hypothetical protein [Shewanella sp.]HAY93859.1 hypothetical protein [Shewanella sp.]